MNDKHNIGAKTLKLLDLIKLGLNVPKFKAIDSRELEENLNNLQPIANKIHAELNCKKYAVRSSALIEDSKEESFAGQFKTLINVDGDNLTSAIKEITTHAKEFLDGDLSKFSVLIQEYIEPDIAGVTFTRNPTGGREMIIESHKGRGEDLVSGKIKPEKSILYRPDNEFKQIEHFYKFPQDIEWCIKNGKYYFLQTRPITTISENEFKQSLYLDETLPQTDFYYEKTEISEIAPRPTQITENILSEIYKENGPIQQVYKKFRINYYPKNIIKIIGNELFVDKEKELKTLLPAYSYLKSKDLTPKLSGLSGIFKTIKNLFFIYKIKLDNHEDLYKKLKNAVETSKKISTIDEFLKQFNNDYQIVFEINLLAGISLKNIANLINKDLSLSLLLSQGEYFLPPETKFDLKLNTEHLTGNTIEVSDESAFTRNISIKNTNNEVKEWWENLSEIKKTVLRKKIEQAVIYNRLRELSRWLVVKRISELRELLFLLAEKNNLKDKRLIYFASLEEVQNEKISQSICEERKQKYEKYSNFNMPKILTNKILTQTQKTQGVSPGQAKGILLEENQLNDLKYKSTDKILFTKVLSPELVKHFSQIKGIISEQGGFLSHLSIIAREQALPVVTGVSKTNLKIGNTILIDGNSGKITHP